MGDEQPVYVTFSSDVVEVLAESNVDLETQIQEQLKRDGIAATVSWTKNPTSTEDDRELILTILAVGVAVSFIGTAVAKVIDAISRGRHATIIERELTPALDGAGKPILDSIGNPVYKVSEKPGAAPATASSRAKVTAGKMFHVEMADGDAARSAGG